MRDLCLHVCRECRKPSRPTGSSGQRESTRWVISGVSFQTKPPMECLVNRSWWLTVRDYFVSIGCQKSAHGVITYQFSPVRICIHFLNAELFAFLGQLYWRKLLVSHRKYKNFFYRQWIKHQTLNLNETNWCTMNRKYRCWMMPHWMWIPTGNDKYIYSNKQIHLFQLTLLPWTMFHSLQCPMVNPFVVGSLVLFTFIEMIETICEKAFKRAFKSNGC